MQAKYLYIFWDAKTTVSSVEYDAALATESVLVVLYKHGRFNVIKDRYMLSGTVPLKELL